MRNSSDAAADLAAGCAQTALRERGGDEQIAAHGGRRARDGGRAARWASLRVLAAAVSAAVASIAFFAARGVRLPAPPGPFAVGTTLRAIEPGTGVAYAPNVARPGSIALQVWYPAANPRGAHRAPYEFGVDDRMLRTRAIGWLVRTESYVDAASRAGAYPVVLYVPGWGGRHNDNTALVQALASAGFIVVAVDDRYPLRPLDFTSAAAASGSIEWADTKVELQTSVVRAVLDALPQLAAADPSGTIAGRFDLTRIGILGFSFGGAVAAQTARSDPRVRAAVNLDGWLFGSAAADGVPRPFLVMSDEPDAVEDVTANSQPLGDGYRRAFDALDERRTLAGLTRYGGYLLSIRGTDHFNFSDVPFFPSLRRTGLGPIDGRRAARIITDYTVQFFDHYLNGRPAPLFEPAAADVPGGGPRRRLDAAGQLRIWPGPE